MTCRKCKEPIEAADNFARKSTRHNYHWNCLLEDKQFFEKRIILYNLPRHMVERMPWKVAENHDVVCLVREILAGK